ncbi:diguanylate cyclase [Thioalkalivibrio sp. XN8]|uniref:diguanylate cyclase n=1 Tax=Thioalkalivibrio sp. XN8 TaxID=2712863 RepID=UPI0013EE2BDC|nr:diguanylate cyclase [Thioalkalivibrio sp. XN8]NGP54080.1 diguanylate cyclase [Thioalkalivibrio sp. XN8]
MYRLEVPELFALLLRTEDVGLAVKALDGRYVYANPGYARVLGVEDARTVPGQQDVDLLPQPAAAAFDAAQHAVQQEQRAILVEHESADAADQATCFLVTHFPVRDDAGELVAVGVVGLATGSRQVPDATRAALRSAEQVNAQLESAVRSLQELASTDGLTGAWNRRRFEEALASETHRAVRFGHPLSLALIDIDHFKGVNDNFGHPTGDRVLAEFADCLRDGMRRSDSLTRWGGEEFIILMPNTPLPAAQRSAERLRERIEQCQFQVVGGLTASIGVAEFAPAESPRDWLRRADDALYRAKKRGRNLVEADLSTASEAPAEHLEGNFVRLVWKPRFASGHALIDAQHRALFEDANQLLEAMLSGRPRDEIGELIDRLIEDIRKHFRDEERILAELGFAACEAHGKEHASLLARALEMADTFRAGKLSTGELFEFLAYDVVARHLLGADRQYFGLLQAPREP